jgi:hypothetical protein
MLYFNERGQVANFARQNYFDIRNEKYLHRSVFGQRVEIVLVEISQKHSKFESLQKKNETKYNSDFQFKNVNRKHNIN